MSPFIAFILPLLYTQFLTVAIYASVPDFELFPYDVPHDTRFYFGDDEFAEYNFRTPFSFFNRSHTKVFISGNGQVSFNEGIREFTPSCSPSSTPMIMAYWADTDNEEDVVNAKLLYRESIDQTLLNKASHDIKKAFPDMRGITLTWMFIVTWKELPFFGMSVCNDTSVKNRRNTFQLVLASDGRHSFAIMYYSNIQWTTGKASDGDCSGLGGDPAKAGFDYGDSKTLYTIPGSCTDSIVNIGETSNINETGKWIFRIDSSLMTAECEEFDGDKQKLKLSPNIVSYFGNLPLRVEGPCLQENTQVTCIYKDFDLKEPMQVALEGTITTDFKAAMCPIPYFYSAGRKTFSLEVTYFNESEFVTKEDTFTGHLYVTNDASGQEFQFSLEESTDNPKDILVDLKWNPGFFSNEVNPLSAETAKQSSCFPKRDTVDLTLESFDGNTWKKVGVIKSSIPNTGQYNGMIDIKPMYALMNQSQPELMIISMSGTPHPIRVRRFFWKAVKKLGKAIVNVGKKVVKHVVKHAKPVVKKLFAKPESAISKVIDTILMITKVTSIIGCQAWNIFSQSLPTDVKSYPPTIQLARFDRNFEEIKNLFARAANYALFHPDAKAVFRQRVASPSGAGSRCAYNDGGTLMVGLPGGSVIERYSPNYSMFKHIFHDVLPFTACCKTSDFANDLQCKYMFYRKRGYGGLKYRAPRVTRAVGDPHIATFDGLFYTFNGVGEFWMINMTGEGLTFKMQARMEQYVSPEGVKMGASVFTAMVLEQVLDQEKVTIQVAYGDGRVIVDLDGDLVDVDDQKGLIIPHKDYLITINSPEKVSVSFSCGLSFTFTTVGPTEAALNIAGMADSKISDRMISVAGLMGNLDGDLQNDLQRPDGRILPSNSTTSVIHYCRLVLAAKGYAECSKDD